MTYKYKEEHSDVVLEDGVAELLVRKTSMVQARNVLASLATLGMAMIALAILLIDGPGASWLYVIGSIFTGVGSLAAGRYTFSSIPDVQIELTRASRASLRRSVAANAAQITKFDEERSEKIRKEAKKLGVA